MVGSIPSKRSSTPHLRNHLVVPALSLQQFSHEIGKFQLCTTNSLRYPESDHRTSRCRTRKTFCQAEQVHTLSFKFSGTTFSLPCPAAINVSQMPDDKIGTTMERRCSTHSTFLPVGYCHPRSVLCTQDLRTESGSIEIKLFFTQF